MRKRTPDNYWTISHKTQDYIHECLGNDTVAVLYHNDHSTSWEELIQLAQWIAKLHRTRVKMTVNRYSVTIQKVN